MCDHLRVKAGRVAIRELLALFGEGGGGGGRVVLEW